MLVGSLSSIIVPSPGAKDHGNCSVGERNHFV